MSDKKKGPGLCSRPIKINTLRHLVQLAATVLMNGYAAGYRRGRIFTGSSKLLCVPVLNCYSCPGALGSCPIGSLQSLLSSKKTKFSFYVLGLLMLFGVLMGRLVCGFLCPFGLLQDLLYKLPLPKLDLPPRTDRILRKTKYVVLLLGVILLPMFLKNAYGIGTTYFCKYICPAGTLGAGFPLLISNPTLRKGLGLLFRWKVGVLVVILVWSMVTYRPFCKYLCPLGAFYSLFNRFSYYRLELEAHKCTNCGACEKTCPMQVQVRKEINSPECIRCGRCQDVCPAKAIHRK